jgi:predicted AlkP superfamily phosphohydrolase/phosphomutase
VYLTEKARRQEGRAERATREVAEIFRLIADPETGQQVFADVIPVADRWQIDPAESGWPDMIAIPSEGYEPRADWPYKEKVRILEKDASHFTAASSSGFMALSGPGVDPQQTLRGMLQDVAPTVLKWLDLPLPEGLEGHAFGTPGETQIYQPHIRPANPRTVVLNSRMTSTVSSQLS